MVGLRLRLRSLAALKEAPLTADNTSPPASAADTQHTPDVYSAYTLPGAHLPPYRSTWPSSTFASPMLNLALANAPRSYTYAQPHLGRAHAAFERAHASSHSAASNAPTHNQPAAFESSGARDQDLALLARDPSSATRSPALLLAEQEALESPKSGAAARLWPYYSHRPLISTRAPVPQKLPRGFLSLVFDPHPALEKVLSDAARVTDEQGRWQVAFAPTSYWLQEQQLHISLTRPFAALKAEHEDLVRAAQSLADRSAPRIRFARFDAMVDDWATIAYLAASVDEEPRQVLTHLSNQAHARISRILRIPPRPYYADMRFHVSFLAARIESRDGPIREVGGTPFDRSLSGLGNAELLLRHGRRLPRTEGRFDGAMPPLHRISKEEVHHVATTAEKRVGCALRALPPVRAAGMALSLGTKLFTFPFR